MLCVVLLGAVGCGTQPAVKCTTSNCSGCCTEAGDCLGSSKQSTQACGGAGADCRVCLPDQLCNANKCVHDPNSTVVLDDAGAVVDAGVADGGVACGGRGQPCCANQACFLTFTCQRGGVCDVAAVVDSGACGALGQPCCANQTCTFSGAICASGTCLQSSTNDAGVADAGAPPKAAGEACLFDRDCLDGACLSNGFQGGYCTKACTTSGDCLVGSQCGFNSTGVGPTKICLKQCAMAGQAPGGCRTDYVCEANAGTSGLAVCVPKCASNITCGAPTCDSRGFCCGAPGAVCCEGATCSTGTCQAGSCVAGGTGGGSGSTGGGSGSTGGGSGTTGGGSGTTGGGTGTTGAVGAACTNYQSDCAQGNNACLTGVYSGGYCSKVCDSAVCPAGSSCSPYASGSVNKYCLQNCTWNGGSGGCRAGYVCDRGLIPGNAQETCIPSCPASACVTGTRCESGFCCGKSTYRCCASGTPCASGTCNANGYCP